VSGKKEETDKSSWVGLLISATLEAEILGERSLYEAKECDGLM
jgi:hypothetical protein